MMFIASNFRYNTYNTSLNQPSFGHKLPNKVFYDIKDIPKLKCGCCGHDMFKTDEVSNMLKSFEAGSKRALENDALLKFKDTEAYQFLLGLSKEAPKSTIRELLSVPKNGVQMRDLHPKTQLDIMQIALIADGITSRSQRVIERLSKYRDCFGDDLKAVFDTMEIYSEMYPKKTFAEIFNLPEIKNYHAAYAEEAKAVSSQQKIEVFKQLRTLADTLTPNDKHNLLQTNSDAIKILNSGIYQPDITKALVEDLYLKFISGSSNKRIKKQLMQIVSKFPFDVVSPVDTFITNSVIKKRSDKDIIRLFLNDMLATFEHVRPHSKEGADGWENGIVLCKRCNRKRADLPYTFFLSLFPQMKVNIQKQCNRIMAFIKGGRLKGYDTYPQDIKETMLRETDNTIRINISKYLKFKEEEANLKYKRAQAVFADDEKAFNDAAGEIRNIDDRIEEVMKIVRQLKKERRAASETMNAAAEARRNSAGELKDAEIELRHAKEYLEEDSAINQTVKPKRIKKRLN